MLQVVPNPFLGESGELFFNVCKKFEEKYWASTFPVSYEDFSDKFLERNCISELSSKKYPSSKNKSSESEFGYRRYR